MLDTQSRNGGYRIHTHFQMLGNQAAIYPHTSQPVQLSKSVACHSLDMYIRHESIHTCFTQSTIICIMWFKFLLLCGLACCFLTVLTFQKDIDLTVYGCIECLGGTCHCYSVCRYNMCDWCRKQHGCQKNALNLLAFSPSWIGSIQERMV